MAHIEANNPNLSVEFHDREENVPAVVRSETSQDSVDLAQLVQSLINGEAFKSVMGQESLDAEYAPDDEVSTASQLARESAEKAYALHLERQQSAVTAPDVNSAETPDVSQTSETAVTLPPEYTYATTYSDLVISSTRNLREAPSLNGAVVDSFDPGSLRGIKVTSIPESSLTWYFIPNYEPNKSAFMGVDNSVSVTSTDIAVTPTSVATPEVTPEQTVIPPQAGTDVPTVVEATSTPELPGPGVAEAPTLPQPSLENPVIDIEALDLERYYGEEIFRAAYRLPNGTENTIIWRMDTSKFPESFRKYVFTEQSLPMIQQIFADRWRNSRESIVTALSTNSPGREIKSVNVNLGETLTIVITPEESSKMISRQPGELGILIDSSEQNVIWVYLGAEHIFAGEDASRDRDFFAYRSTVAPAAFIEAFIDQNNQGISTVPELHEAVIEKGFDLMTGVPPWATVPEDSPASEAAKLLQPTLQPFESVLTQ